MTFNLTAYKANKITNPRCLDCHHCQCVFADDLKAFKKRLTATFDNMRVDDVERLVSVTLTAIEDTFAWCDAENVKSYVTPECRVSQADGGAECESYVQSRRSFTDYL